MLKSISLQGPPLQLAQNQTLSILEFAFALPQQCIAVRPPRQGGRCSFVYSCYFGVAGCATSPLSLAPATTLDES